MNKIICDICGTDYPETADQCPICGCANAGGQTLAGEEASGGAERSSQRVKGGRYSKANVRKRLKNANMSEAYIPESVLPEPEDDSEYEEHEDRDEQGTYEDYADDDDQDDIEEEEHGSNRGLVVVVIILLLAIVAVSAYIAVSIFGLGLPELPFFKQPTEAPTTSQTQPATQETPAAEIPCVEMVLSDVDISLTAKGETLLLTAEVQPADTTDEIVFRSEDESVVTVDESGLVTAVGSGKTSIIVTCGSVVVDCPVICSISEEATEPAETTEPTDPPAGFVLKLDKSDFTLFKAGATFDIYSGAVNAADITWTTDNDQVATIEAGIVTAVGNGRTRVYGEYNGQKVSCWVGCKLPADAVTEPTEATQPGETTEPVETTAYKLLVNGSVSPFGDEENAEVTIAVGESFRLTVEDAEGVRQDVTWKASKEGICEVNGRSISGEKAGKVKLTAKVGSQTFTCTIIVK